MCDITVEVAYFAGYGTDQFGLVGREMGESLSALGMLNLFVGFVRTGYS